MGPFLNKASNRLPLTEIEDALKKLGLHSEHNTVLSRFEKDKLDQEGVSQLRGNLNEEQLVQMRRRYDIAIVRDGNKPENIGTRGISELVDKVVGPINKEGLLDSIFYILRFFPTCRAAFSGTHFKFIGSNYHYASGYGHQGIHADFLWG